MATEIHSPPVENRKMSEVVDTQQTITLSRRIVYFQAALLGVIATTFFVFGMMVGTLTSQNTQDAKIVDCTITGKVVWSDGERNVGDGGAVVLILPLGQNPEQRLNPQSIHPDSFRPIDNEVIETIVALGGAVVRTNRDGTFNVEVNSPAKYSVVVVSNGSSSIDELTKKQMAALSTYFMPVENVRDGKSVFVKAVRLDSTRLNLGEIEF